MMAHTEIPASQKAEAAALQAQGQLMGAKKERKKSKSELCHLRECRQYLEVGVVQDRGHCAEKAQLKVIFRSVI